jgi:hypothetical protein
VAFGFAAFVDHPLNSVVGDEVLIGDPNEFQIAPARFGAQGRLRQPATEEQLASIIKSDRVVVPDINRVCHPRSPQGLSTGARRNALRLVTIV